jgi:hypothetical protein
MNLAGVHGGKEGPWCTRRDFENPLEIVGEPAHLDGSGQVPAGKAEHGDGVLVKGRVLSHVLIRSQGQPASGSGFDDPRAVIEGRCLLLAPNVGEGPDHEPPFSQCSG